MKNIEIKKYRSFAFYPSFLFEVEANVNGKIVYANMDVLSNIKNNEKVTCAEICEERFYYYDASILDIEDCDEHYVDLAREEENALLEMMVELWNKNPQINDDVTWKEF